MTIENVIQIIEAADKSNTQDMKKYALELIVQNFPRVARQSQMRNLSRPLLLDILYALADAMPSDESRLTHDMSFFSLHE